MFGQLLLNKNKIATVLHSVSGPNFGSRIWYLNKLKVEVLDLAWVLVFFLDLLYDLTVLCFYR
jgi:hypothetical protein